MMAYRPAAQPVSVAAVRLNAISPLDAPAVDALRVAADSSRRYRAKREMLAEGQELYDTLLILSGWAACQRILEDGRRQIVSILLPGDLIGLCDYDRPLAISSVVALTDVEVCMAPRASVSPSLARAYALSKATAEANLVAQITRLGRMNAQDRIADLLLELLERLELAGMAVQGRYDLPLTQELIADAVGLTSVHVNRTLQTLRREGWVELKGRDLIVQNPDALRRSIARGITRVTAR